jgi:hypothetical protein
LALLLIGILAYGLMIPYLGFYWDDWESVYLYHLHSPALIFPYFAERPLSALIYLILFPITRMIPIIWQVVAFLLRWIGVVFLYLTLNAVWPTRIWLNRWIGALLLIFPGFLEQQVAITYSRHFTAFTLFAISLYLTVLAFRKRKYFWLWMSLSILLGYTQIFMIEYFVGLELIRPVIIGAILWAGQKEKKHSVLWKTLLYWSPFFLGLGIYIWWRVFYFPSTLATDPNNPNLLKAIFSSPLTTLNLLFKAIYQDIGYLVLSVWGGAFSPNLIDLYSKVMWASWFVGIITAILFGFYINKTSGEKKAFDVPSFIHMLVLGGVAILAGAIPVWLTGRQVADGKWSDRFSLGPLLGAVILIVSILDWLCRTRNQKNWLLAILVASSISYQIYNAYEYRKDWEIQRNIYWQLHWRVPALQPGTALFGRGTFTDKSSYYDGSYILNLIFDNPVHQDMRYAYFDIYHNGINDYFPGIPLTQAPRGTQFSGNTSQALVFDFGVRGGCVKVLDAIYKDDPDLSPSVADLFKISDTTNISAANVVPLNSDIFGSEPAHSWCYYFEKADLARQMKNWPVILQLDTEARANNLNPNLGSEYLPFIEAYAQTGQWSQAFELSQNAQEYTASLDPLLCNDWQRFAEIVGGIDRVTYLAKANSEFCGITTK